MEPYSYRLTDVVRSAVERGTKQASDIVSERRLEVSRDQALRATAGALLAAAIVNASMSGSPLRLFAALIRDGNMIAWTCLIAIFLVAFSWVALTFLAFMTVEMDDRVDGHALKSVMEDSTASSSH